MKKQIVFIGGGEAFDSYEDYLAFLKAYKIDKEKFDKRYRQKVWTQTLGEKLGQDFEVIQLKMPNNMNVKYTEWKIMFEKHIPFFEKELSFLGNSLGATFLVKYLSENNFLKKIRGVFLVGAAFDEEDSDESLGDFKLSDNLKKLKEQGGKIFFYQSKDDPIVPFLNVEKYLKKLPDATARIFENRGHFMIEEFPELVEDIKSLYDISH